MTNFNISIGSPSATRLSGVTGSKYSTAPRTGQFDATFNGELTAAWTTEGRGSHYIYFKDGVNLYYVKVAGPGELTAARQKLVITTDAYEEVMKQIEPAKKSRTKTSLEHALAPVALPRRTRAKKV